MPLAALRSTLLCVCFSVAAAVDTWSYSYFASITSPTLWPHGNHTGVSGNIGKVLNVTAGTKEAPVLNMDPPFFVFDTDDHGPLWRLPRTVHGTYDRDTMWPCRSGEWQNEKQENYANGPEFLKLHPKEAWTQCYVGYFQYNSSDPSSFVVYHLYFVDVRKVGSGVEREGAKQQRATETAITAKPFHRAQQAMWSYRLYKSQTSTFSSPAGEGETIVSFSITDASNVTAGLKTDAYYYFDADAQGPLWRLLRIVDSEYGIYDYNTWWPCRVGEWQNEAAENYENGPEFLKLRPKEAWTQCFVGKLLDDSRFSLVHLYFAELHNDGKEAMHQVAKVLV